jgi:hypothetical protein
VNENGQSQRQGGEPLHDTEDDDALQRGYRYGADGIGVRADLVQAVLDAWSSISPTGDPAAPLHSVNDGAINSVDNLARLAAAAVARTITPRPTK